MADLKGFTEKYGLNSRLVKRNGTLVEEVYRVGGRYDAQIRAVIGHLEAAMPFATPSMTEALAALVQFYRTGEEADRRAYDIAWVKDKASPVDTINGFIEVYLDARGMKGAWEALVFYVNREKTVDIKKLATSAQWFEDRMPWAPEYRKAGVTGHHRQRHRRGHRNRRLRPDHADRHQPAQRPDGPRGSTAASRCRCRTSTRPTTSPPCRRCAASSRGRPRKRRAPRSGAPWPASCTTNMHEVIGHASGKVSDAVERQSRQAVLKEQYLRARRRPRRPGRPLLPGRPQAGRTG